MTKRPDPTQDESMTERDTEQLLADWFHEDAPSQEPPVLLPAVLARTAMTRRRPRWRTRDWWLSVLGLVDRGRPPMMLSVGFVAILTALALAAALALVPGDDEQVEDEVLLATIVVAADGSGDYLTVAAAVEAAEDGNIILIRPGEYLETVDTTKSLTFRGDGDEHSDVVIRAATMATPAIRTSAAATTVEHLTVRVASAPDAIYNEAAYQPFGIHIVGGPASVSDVEIIGNPVAGCGLVLDLDSDFAETGQTNTPTSTVRDVHFGRGAGGLCTGAVGALSVRGNTFENLDVAMRVAGEDIEVSGNTFTNNGDAVTTRGGDSFLRVIIEGNDFTGNDSGVRFTRGQVHVVENTFDGGGVAIEFQNGTHGRIADNVLRDITSGGVILRDSDPLVERNTFTGGQDAIRVFRGEPWLMGNDIDGVGGTAIAVTAGSRPKIVGNRLCDNATDLDLPEGLDSTIGGNPVCSGAETRTWDVAQDGSGDFSTIGAAVDATADGDSIVVQPGIYDESIVLGKDVTIRGSGDRGDVVVEVSAPFPRPLDDSSMDRYRYRDPPFAFWIVESEATIENLTVRGESSTIIVRGGAPTLQEVDLIGLGQVFEPLMDLIPFTGLSFEGDSSGALRDSNVVDTDLQVQDGADVEVHGNTFSGGSLVIEGPSTDAIVSENRITGSGMWAIAVWGGAKPLIADNVIITPTTGIDVHTAGNPIINRNFMDGPFGRIDLVRDARDGIGLDFITEPVIEGNRINGATRAAISIEPFGAATIEDNQLLGNSIGVRVVEARPVTLAGNHISAGRTAVVIQDSAPALEGNDIRDANTFGVSIVGSSSPTLTRNTVCDNAQDLFIADDATPVIDDTNEICGTAAAE